MGMIQVSPFHRSDFTLAGFLLSGRWPQSTHEWAQFLAVAARWAAQPGGLITTTVFRAVDDKPQDPQPDLIGMVTSAGPVIGPDAPGPGDLADPQPSALIVLHPPSETIPSTPEVAGVASGAILLPGLPHLGLDHRASWVEVEADGTVTMLRSRCGVNPSEDPDLAVLATLCAA
jgi:hypothetical protein